MILRSRARKQKGSPLLRRSKKVLDFKPTESDGGNGRKGFFVARAARDD
jgi:hypothetical protein